MTTQNTKNKIVEETTNYVWGRLKFIGLMILLLIVVKDHPGWDTFFGVMIVFQCILGVLYILKMQERLTEEARQRYEKSQKDFNKKWEYYGEKQQYQQNKQRPTISATLELNKSAQLLGVNVLQDDKDVIKKKYRKLAMKYHPDKYSNESIEKQDIAKRNFQKLNAAYSVIKKHKNIS